MIIKRKTQIWEKILQLGNSGSHDRERERERFRCNIIGTPLSREMQIISRSLALAPIYKFRRGVEKGARLSKCKLRRSPPEDRFSDFQSRIIARLPADGGRARVGDDRSRSRWHSAQWLFLPLLEKPFVSAYGFTALWFYHLNSASSDLFYHSPLALRLSRSRTLSVSVSRSPSHTLLRSRAVARDTT